ncbi:PREDICTED: uncharacterized protein LOC109174213 [Ipomoea nil]|uniref:uncharacterized protein LOC109174213 n=1 Tax=Ipomoea nil TaxID=35883 RepID=UPI0009016496|nr:PREDICTED: uncharacterized protein LOC109174213 [Ipomoea nil]
MEETLAWLIEEVNERNKREVQAITLRSGKALQKESNTSTPSRDDIPCTSKNVNPPNEEEHPEPKDDKGEDEPILLNIDMPFVDALGEMPRSAKFLKELLSNKKRLDETATIVLGEECSALLHKEMPRKLKDPRSFTIPCNIGDSKFSKALADLGASINLMPYGLYNKLKLGAMKPTRIFIQLADGSTKYPRGVVEDMLVRVDKFIFQVDFVILDMDSDVKVPLILGSPSLATARALIDMGSGKLVIRVGEDSANR